jgi:hypothetical protein
MVYYIYPVRNVWMSKGAKAGPWRAKYTFSSGALFSICFYMQLSTNPYPFYGLI